MERAHLDLSSGQGMVPEREKKHEGGNMWAVVDGGKVAGVE